MSGKVKHKILHTLLILSLLPAGRPCSAGLRIKSNPACRRADYNHNSLKTPVGGEAINNYFDSVIRPANRLCGLAADRDGNSSSRRDREVAERPVVNSKPSAAF